MQTQTILRVVKCRIQETGMNVKIYLITDAQWRIQGGGSLEQLPPKPLWRPLEWRPFAINALLFVAHGDRNRFKNTLK